MRLTTNSKRSSSLSVMLMQREQLDPIQGSNPRRAAPPRTMNHVNSAAQSQAEFEW